MTTDDQNHQAVAVLLGGRELVDALTHCAHVPQRQRKPSYSSTKPLAGPSPTCSR